MNGPRYSRRDFLAGVLATGTVAAVGTYFAPGGRSITLNFVTGEDPTGARDRLVDMWNGANPRAFVRVDQLSDSTVDAQAAMITKVESGNADVLNLDVIDIPYFRREGHIEPIELPDDAEFVDATLVASKLEDPGKDMYWAAPFNADVGMLFERVATDDADTAGPTLKAVVDQLATGTPRRFAGQLNPLSTETGEAFAVNVLEHALSRDDRILQRGSGTPTLELNVWQAALQPLRDSLAAGRITQCDSEDDTRNQFRQKGLTYMRNWPVEYRKLQTDGDQDAVRGGVRVTPLGVGVLGGQSLALAGKSFAADPFGTARAAATDFIRFLTGEPAQKILAAYGFPPSRNGAYTDDTLTAFIPHLGAIRGAVENARPRPVDPDYPAFSATTFVPTMKRVLLQGEDLWTPTGGGTALGTEFAEAIRRAFY